MTSDDRLRVHPKERLAGPVKRVDVMDAAAKLHAETHAPVAGHRQLALVRQGPLAVILFAFDKEGVLKEHQADGEVIIHVLRGRLSVDIDGESILLTAGTFVALTPGQRHSVRAQEESDMLLSIARLPARTAGGEGAAGAT